MSTQFMSSLCQHWPPAIGCCIWKRQFGASFNSEIRLFCSVIFSISMLKRKIMISPAFVYFSTRNRRNGGENSADNAQKKFIIPTNKDSRLLGIFNEGKPIQMLRRPSQVSKAQKIVSAANLSHLNRETKNLCLFDRNLAQNVSVRAKRLIVFFFSTFLGSPIARLLSECPPSATNPNFFPQPNSR